MIRPIEFDVGRCSARCAACCGRCCVNESVALVFDEPRSVPPLYTDEAKVSQILRNFISNALKFTERGEVRVSARRPRRGERDRVRGRATPASASPRRTRSAIFEEFTQIDSPLQRRVKGTGLGLPLCRKLAELLGGCVRSRASWASARRSRAVIPVIYEPPRRSPRPVWDVDPTARAGAGRRGQPRDAARVREDARRAPASRCCRRAHRARGTRRARRPSGRAPIVLDIMLQGRGHLELPHRAEAPAATCATSRWRW